MVRGTEQVGALERQSKGFHGTDLVPVRTQLPTVSEIKNNFTLTKEKKRPFFQSVCVLYMGNKRWKIGLVPISGDRAQWLEGLPYSEVLHIMEQLEGRIRRVDPDSPEARHYV